MQVGNGPINAVVFGAYGNAQRVLEDVFPQQPSAGTGDLYFRLSCCAMWAGLLQTFVATPVELVKCKLQVRAVVPCCPVLLLISRWCAACADANEPGARAVFRRH